MHITSGIVTCTAKLRKKKILSIYGRFPKRKSASISSRGTLPMLPFAHRQLSDIRLCPFGRTVHTKLDKVVMKRLRIPIVRPLKKLPSSLSHGIICNLLARRLTFGNLVFASTLTVEKMSNGADIDLRTLGTNGSVMLTPEGLGARITTIVRTISHNRLSHRSVSHGYQGMLACGCMLNLGEGPTVRLSKLKDHVGAPRAHSLVQHLGLTTVAMLGGGNGVLPLRSSGRVPPVTLLRMNSIKRASVFTGRLRGRASLIHFHLHGRVARTRKGTLESSLSGCHHIVITITRRQLTPFRPFFTTLTTSGGTTPTVCVFFAPKGVVLRVRHTISTTRSMILTRSTNRSMRRRITSMLFTHTSTSKQLSTDLKKLFPANTKIAVAPRAPARFGPRRCKVSSITLEHVSSVTGQNVRRKTCPKYRVIVLGSKGAVCSRTFKARTNGKDTLMQPASLCSLTSLSGAAKALLTLVGLCSENHFGLSSGLSSCLP